MNLKDILAVSGLPGLYKMVVSRNNGLMVSDLDTGKTKFCSVRKHQFTPMETVAIYTMEDSIDMKTIFGRMKDQIGENPPAPVKSSDHEIEDYFASIVPDYDEDRVYIRDMKKVIKWFNILNEKGLLDESDEEE